MYTCDVTDMGIVMKGKLTQVVDYLFFDTETNKSSNISLSTNCQDYKMMKRIVWKTLAGSLLRHKALTVPKG